MSCSSAENWSLTRSLAWLAGVFAIVIGTLMPFAVMAAVQPGQPIVICSAQGYQTIHNGGLDGPVKQHLGAKCADCIVPLEASVPAPSLQVPEPPVRFVISDQFIPLCLRALPPARAPPRPPSTAPPHA